MLSCLLNNQRINCFDRLYDRDQLKKWASKDILLCPACGKPYEYCHGKVRSPYFRHKDKIKCEDKYSEPETEEHLKGKRDLYEWIKEQDGVTDVVLEGWIPETKQRPDIMFKYKGEQYVFEYQCSPIATEYYERHKLYQVAGIKDIWICGTQKYLTKEENEKSKNFRLKEIEKQTYFYYDSDYKIFIMNNYFGNIQDIMNYKYVKDTFYFSYSHSYGDMNYRNSLDNILKVCNNKLFTKLDYLKFDDNVVFKQNTIIDLNNYYNLVNKEKIINDNNLIKVKQYFERVFEIFYNKYSYKFTLEQYSDGIIFTFFGVNICIPIESYPNLSLRQLCSMNPEFSFNIENFKTEQMVEYLYNVSFSYKEARIHYDIINKFKRFKDKKIYLLFIEDKNKKVSDNIRFKFIKEYYDNKEDNAKNILNEFKFLNKIKATDFIFMIPYKRIKYGIFNSYTVKNYKNKVIEDFYSYGLRNIYFYEDLIKEYKQ